jgi:hypothetical protein
MVSLSSVADRGQIYFIKQMILIADIIIEIFSFRLYGEVSA